MGARLVGRQVCLDLGSQRSFPLCMSDGKVATPTEQSPNATGGMVMVDVEAADPGMLRPSTNSTYAALFQRHPLVVHGGQTVPVSQLTTPPPHLDRLGITSAIALAVLTQTLSVCLRPIAMLSLQALMIRIVVAEPVVHVGSID